MKAMKRILYTSITLSLRNSLNQMLLQFHNSRIGEEQVRQLSLLPSREKDVGEIDYGIFVSIDSEVFERIATDLNDSNALVTLTNSQVKFSVEAKEISLVEERRECMIGGLSRSQEIRFFVSLNPIIFFRDLARRSKRIWLFKSAKAYSIIIAPIGLYAQFCVYFSRRG
ncbi:uncharacterized protein LOC111494875 [Cucurbita maxima]|uniref:Uncharacterized protein LOC111494875 n=1 Tax=Cucurbita maxima TaxID=3661 RepID=A0A6J1KGC4_CUCMA|nr:uncharacterized protein LOC111494875 [Cucurbita maxima]